MNKCVGQRTAVFKWLGAVAVTLPKSQLSALLPHLMTSLVREMMVVEPSGDELRRLAKDVGDVMRRRVGAEEYTRQLARLQAQLEARRTGRKSKRAQEELVPVMTFLLRAPEKLWRLVCHGCRRGCACKKSALHAPQCVAVREKCATPLHRLSLWIVKKTWTT
uniref:U3 small nucleolar RNA-associated protein 20 C-terminal domain-containing protein n=1 Tax=Timema shepardi TaxID=629360 RepID=A0A7R9BB26_TIMSH|nr:unnamed protein product [Timema shepardi]